MVQARVERCPIAALSLHPVRTRDRAVLAALTAVLAVAPITALAAKKTRHPRLTNTNLWATVDVCNTAAHPDTIGIRGAMPGDDDPHQRLYMRFVVEYRSASGHWHYFHHGGQSRMRRVGNGGARSRQSGQNFQLSPTFSSTYVLRGVVLFQWRLHGRVVASSARSTSGGHQPAAGSDPPGFSAALCTIQPNSRGSLVITPVTPSAAMRASRRSSLTVHA
jgi:hypothetical protein